MVSDLVVGGLRSLNVDDSTDRESVLLQVNFILWHSRINHELLPVDDLLADAATAALMALFVKNKVVGLTRK